MKSIALIGMMGAGKSTVGRRLGAQLGRDFIDVDRELEARCGVSITTIFELEGEAGFRRREQALIDELTARPGLVLATGGGVVTGATNRLLLAARCTVVYLHTTVQEIWLRTRRDKGRPLLQTENPRARIAELLTVREPLYREIATITVETGRQPVDRVVAAIIQQLSEPAEPEPPE